MAEPVKTILVAVSRNGIIGRDGDMPWRLSSDLKRFKSMTLGKPVIMGRKTFQSIGKPLPGRPNVVITSRFRVFRRRREGGAFARSKPSTLRAALRQTPVLARSASSAAVRSIGRRSVLSIGC